MNAQIYCEKIFKFDIFLNATGCKCWINIRTKSKLNMNKWFHSWYRVTLNFTLSFAPDFFYVLCPFRTLVIMALHNFLCFVAPCKFCSSLSLLNPVLPSNYTGLSGRSCATFLCPSIYPMSVKFSKPSYLITHHRNFNYSFQC